MYIPNKVSPEETYLTFIMPGACRKIFEKKKCKARADCSNEEQSGQVLHLLLNGQYL